MSKTILEIALPTPLRRRFDYFAPVDMSDAETKKLSAGILVRVPFGHQEMTGVLIKTKDYTDQNLEKLRPALAILDQTPALDSTLLELILWAAREQCLTEGYG